MATEWRCAECKIVGTMRDGFPVEACMCCGGFLWVEAGGLTDKRIMDCQGESVDYTLIPSHAPSSLPADYAKAIEAMLQQNIEMLGELSETRQKYRAEKQARIKAEAERNMCARLLHEVLKMMDRQAAPATTAPVADPLAAALATHDKNRGFKVVT